MKQLCKCFFYIAGTLSLVVAVLILYVIYKAVEISHSQAASRIPLFFQTINTIVLSSVSSMMIYMALVANDNVTILPLIG